MKNISFFINFIIWKVAAAQKTIASLEVDLKNAKSEVIKAQFAHKAKATSEEDKVTQMETKIRLLMSRTKQKAATEAELTEEKQKMAG